MRTTHRPRFGHVFEHGEATSHIPIKRAVTYADFAFVAGRKYERANLFEERHQDIAANARLNILLRRAHRRVVETGRSIFKYCSNVSSIGTT